MKTWPFRSTLAVPASPPNRRLWAFRGRWLAFGALVLFVVAGRIISWPTPAEREAREWLKEFRAIQQQATLRRLPDQPLSWEGQQVLVEWLVRPESKLARVWDTGCRSLPKFLGDRLPRLPLPRDQVIAVGAALIELPGNLELRRRLLEAALRPGAANRMYAVQFASTPWPVPPALLPLLEQLADSDDSHVRMRVALMLHGFPAGNPRVEQLIARLEADQVSVVRETARYSYRSDESGELIPVKPKHAARP